MSAFGMSQPVDGLALGDDANTNASSHCYVGQGFLCRMLSQFELRVCCRVDVGIDASLGLSECLLYGL